MSSSTTASAESAPTLSGPLSTYKGKVTHRSWPQLPEELVRHIATFYLWDRAATTYTPSTWDTREHWHQRMAYTSLRDALDLERNLMSICLQWGLALETHLFWQQAVALIDPTDALGHHAIIHPRPQLTHSSTFLPPPIRITPYRHYRNIISCSCLICRINLPVSSHGLTIAKRTVNTFFLGPIGLCRDHDRRRLAFCGLCLREAPIFEPAAPALYASADLQVAVLENEDEDTWPGVEATCRNCRQEWLWKKASLNPRDREAIGGPELISDDWEARQSVEGFIELAEGTITDVITLAREKWWLRKFTRLSDMMQQALAAAKFNNYPSRGGLRGEPDYGSLDDSLIGDEEEEEDTELMQLEEGGVKDLALGDWARTRILDGHWTSPADIWYGHHVPGHPPVVPAIHPCPWTEEDSNGAQHPSPETVKAEIPPSFSLCEQAFIAHGQQLRIILLPAMKNIVRRIVIECAFSDCSEDATLKISRMSLEDVARMLREEEGVWFDGYDWVERRRNDEESRQSRRSAAARSEEDASSTTSGGSGESGGSNTTSPVLSTTTLQTTPSPPPLSDEVDKRKYGDERENISLPSPLSATATGINKVVIPIAPVLNPPRLLRPIPHIPICLAHLPHYSIDAFKNVWREACAPLYHCRCRICERAVAAANAADGTMQGILQAQQASQQTSQRQPLSTNKQLQPQLPVQIQLQEVTEIDFEEVAECDYEEGDYEEFEDDCDEEEQEKVTEYVPPVTSSRKRSLDHIEDLDSGRREASPPKKVRREKGAGEEIELIQRKRSSEELEEERMAGNKRVKIDIGQVGSLSPATWGMSEVGSAEPQDGSEAGYLSSSSPGSCSPARRTGSPDGILDVDEAEYDNYATWYVAAKRAGIRSESVDSRSDSEPQDGVSEEERTTAPRIHGRAQEGPCVPNGSA